MPQGGTALRSGIIARGGSRGAGKPAGPLPVSVPSGADASGGCRVGSRAVLVWPFSVQVFRNFSHRPWWTCPVAFGSWGSGGRFLRARPLRRRGTAETVRRRSLWAHSPCGTGFVGRLLPVAPISSLRWLCCQGDQGGVPGYLFQGSFVLRSDRPSSPRPLLDVSFSLTGPFCGLRYCCVCGFGCVHSWGTRFFGAALRSGTGASVSAPSKGLLFGVDARSVERSSFGTCARSAECSSFGAGTRRRSTVLRGGRSARRPIALRSGREV